MKYKKSNLLFLLFKFQILFSILMIWQSVNAFPEDRDAQESLFSKAPYPEAIEICDSLQGEFWKVLRESVSADSFAHQFTAEDSLVCDTVALIGPDLVAWIKFLIVHSNTFNLTGMGSTLRLPDPYYDRVKFDRASTSVSREELSDIYTIIDYENELKNGIPANYTQSLTAATWYDVNKYFINPALFYYFYNLSIVAEGSDGTNTFVRLRKLYGTINRSEEKINSLIQDLFEYSHYLRKRSVSVRQFFHLWPNQESYNLENQFFTDMYFLQYYRGIDDMVTSFDFETSYWKIEKLPKSVLNFFKSERRIPYK